MASPEQVELFNRLVTDKEFPNDSPDPQSLQSQFATLSTKSASTWIEKALALPDKGHVEAPF